MKNILLVGGGKIGAMITRLLAGEEDYHVTVADRSAAALANVEPGPRVSTLELDVADEEALRSALRGKFAVISALPFAATGRVARAAAALGVHYFDLTEDVEQTREVKQLAKQAHSVLMPQCGLAPGFISIAAAHLAGRFDSLEEVRMRVGALTEFPTNRLRYNLTWSTEGLINEYLRPCEAVVDGRLREVEPLEDYEAFTLDGIDYEAFSTSGGLGTLCERLEGVRNLNYKTIRYPGHCEAMKLLIRDLRLDAEALVKIFNDALPVCYQDVVLIFVSVTGRIGGALRQESYVRKVYSREDSRRRWSAIQITTASAICAMLDMVGEGSLPQRGFVHHDQVDFDLFMANRFGRNYGRTGWDDGGRL